MFQFVIGGAKSGKSTYAAHRIEEMSKEPESSVLLLVPEQFTFETEKSLFRSLGGEQFKRVNVTSFTRLATEIFKRYGGIAGQYASDCAKVLLMELTLEEMRDQLSVYQKSCHNKTFGSVMLETVSELKNAGVSPQGLNECAILLPEGGLKEKTTETALIYGAYDALLKNAYRDPLDDLSRAAEIVKDTDFFEGVTVILDEFKGFTAAEMNFIHIILQKAGDVIVTLCMDWERAQSGNAGVFISQLELYNRLLRMARESGRRIKAPFLLQDTYFVSPELRHMEKNLFSPVICPFNGKSRSVFAVLCKNEYDEVDYALSRIAALTQEEGYRYREIAVISRDLDTYLPKLESGFRKFGIPFYADKPDTVLNKPLFRFLQNALACAAKGMSAENILAFLKCGLVPFSPEEVSELENYLYIWDIKPGQWEMPFFQNPRGFQEELSSEDAACLERVNRIRGYAAETLRRFREKVRRADGREACASAVELLEYSGAREVLEQETGRLYAKGDFDAAQEAGRLWDILMEILDTIAAVAGDYILSADKFRTLFELAAQNYDMGTLPQAVDTVIVGSAERIRVSDKRAVFVLGVNENILPFTPVGGGVFSDREREQLIGLEIGIAKPVKDRIKEERFIAYKTLCAPSERLYLTARKANIAGEAKMPSILFSELRRMFGEEAVLDSGELPLDTYCRSAGAAFSVLAGHYLEDTPLRAALLESLFKEESCRERVEGLARVLDDRAFSIHDRKNAAALFGRELHISPTRVESFYQCRFRYFMEQGVKAFPLKKAELDPLETGTLIHKILYAVTAKTDLKNGYDEKKIKALIKQELDHYIETVMGGAEDKTSRFLYLYRRMRESVLKIVRQLHEELSQSLFTPSDYEYEIREGTDVTPLRLMGEDGVVVSVAGKIDRVDTYTGRLGETYVRIVDYKSGKKAFRLNDVLYGLNLQMLLYLHCIIQNGKGKYQDCLPAGILYMPAGEQPPVLDRAADEETIVLAKRKCYQMNGLLLEDRELLAAMDSSMSGIYIPVSLKKDGEFTEASKNSLATLAELGKINAYIDRLVVNMASELHRGKIEALPVEGSCTYCNYRGVCGITKASEVRRYIEYDRETILKEMEEQNAEA